MTWPLSGSAAKAGRASNVATADPTAIKDDFNIVSLFASVQRQTSSHVMGGAAMQIRQCPGNYEQTALAQCDCHVMSITLGQIRHMSEGT
jgi:hypothetical protein